MTLFSMFGSIVLLIYFVLPLGVTLIFARARPDWSKKRLLVLSSGLIPMLNLGLLLFAFVGLVTSEIQRIDALDDAPQREFFGLLFISPVSCLLGLGLGFLAGQLVVRFARSK